MRGGSTSTGVQFGYAAALLLWCATSAAQTEAQMSEAQKRYQEGVALHGKGHDEEARARFAEAYAVVQLPPILFDLARTEQLTGRLVDASRHWRAYIALPDDGSVAEASRAKAAVFLAEIQPKIAHLAIDAPAGATITLDGTEAANGIIDVQPGTHTVVAELGHETRTSTVTVGVGQTAPAKLAFDSLSLPWAPDAWNAGAALFAASQASPPTERPFHYETSSAKTATLIALGVGTAALLATGIGLEVASSNEESDVESDHRVLGSNSACAPPKHSPVCTDLDNAQQSTVTDSNAAGWTFAGAGVFAAATIVTWVVWPKRRVEDATLVVPIVSARMAGLGWTGSF